MKVVAVTGKRHMDLDLSNKLFKRLILAIDNVIFPGCLFN